MKLRGHHGAAFSARFSGRGVPHDQTDEPSGTYVRFLVNLKLGSLIDAKLDYFTAPELAAEGAAPIVLRTRIALRAQAPLKSAGRPAPRLQPVNSFSGSKRRSARLAPAQ